MLILTRRPGESLYLGDKIRITILQLQGKQVKIGLELPDDMTVYREEIYKRVTEENQRALTTSNEGLLDIDTRLGPRTIETDKILYFPRGLAGFEGLHEFTLLQIKPDAPMLILQSLDQPHIGLLVADPYTFLPDYRIDVSDAEQKLLRLKVVRDVAVLVTVSIPQGKPEDMTLNLTGPILINHKERLGLQVPQSTVAAAP